MTNVKCCRCGVYNYPPEGAIPPRRTRVLKPLIEGEDCCMACMNHIDACNCMQIDKVTWPCRYCGRDVSYALYRMPEVIA